MDELLTSTRAAVLLGVSPNTLACWRSNKRYPLTWIKVGSRVRYRRVDIEQFLTLRAQRPQPVR